MTVCDSCRMRMDSLGQVADLERLAEQCSISSTPSPSLRGVMECLLIEGQMLRNSVRFTATPTRDVLPQLQPSNRPGFLGRLGDIEIRQVIGRGGMGVVFEGLDCILDRRVAVKVLSPHLVGDEDAKERFVREARAAATLAQPNIVSIYSINEADGMPYLVLQFVDGESLQERLRLVGKLPLNELLRLGVETARGLATAHENGVIHRDIKPANILLESETGTSRIADFGLAKLAGGDSHTRQGAINGTPSYMSPEQAAGKTVDCRSDLFSLGVVLYEASTGISPFAADSPFVTLSNIRELVPKPIRAFNSELPNWFTAIIEKLLAKEPVARFQSARELIDVLESQHGSNRFMLNRNRQALIGCAFIATVACVLYASDYFGWGSAKDELTAVPAKQSQVPMNGFVVDQRESLPTLAEAIKIATDESVIEIHGNGPFATEAINITQKRLTIRAATNSLPRIVPADIDSSSQSSQFLFSDSDLRLEGLEIAWPIDSTPVKLEEIGTRCVISASGGTLSLIHCRIIAGSQGCCVGGRSGAIDIKNSHLVARTGTCISYPTSGNINISVQSCLLESRSMLLMRPSPSPSQAQGTLHLTMNTIVSDRMMTIMVPNPNRKPQRLVASNNIFDCQTLIGIISQGAPPANQSPKPLNVLRETLNWRDESNLYRKGIEFLSLGLRSQPTTAFASGIRSLEEWLAVWGQPSSKSVEGKVQFDSRVIQSESSVLKLTSLDELSGPMPPDLGVSLGKVGPENRLR